MSLISYDPQKKNTSARGKCIYANLVQPPKNKMSAKKKYFTINFTHLLHAACHILSPFTNHCHCLHLHSQCLHLPHSLHSNPPHCLSTCHQSHPLHWIYSTSSNLSHSLLGEVRRRAVLIHIDQIIHLYFLVYNLFEPMKFLSVFLKRCYWCEEFKCMCSGFLCRVCGLITLEFMALFMAFNFWFGPGVFFLSLVACFVRFQ